ncbi:unnamed protein product [Blepharisma stoltei]|uniref:Uncharacterized protein n=1 Tax=Blepharisma stoltei TaxID=1481888 RepID=A0AAU9ICZ5_9CILI|nr:unnamed protein product [Blepharisma stoltei]
MNAELREDFASSVRKQMTRNCSYRCFTSKNENCLEECYDANITAFNVTAKILREIGYSRHSRLIELAYGQFIDEFDRIATFNDSAPEITGERRHFFERNIYDESKTR